MRLVKLIAGREPSLTACLSLPLTDAAPFIGAGGLDSHATLVHVCYYHKAVEPSANEGLSTISSLPNRTAKLTNGEVGFHQGPGFSKRRSQAPQAVSFASLTRGTSAIIPETK